MTSFTYGHLFILPAPSIMSEERMERNAGWYFDRLDKVFMDPSFAMTQAQYDAHVRKFRVYETACDNLRKLAFSTPHYVSNESQDGAQDLRLSFNIRVF